MQTNIINKYFIIEKDGEKLLRIHKMGTSHREALKRFIVDEEKYKVNTYNQVNTNDSSLFLRMLINPKENDGSRSAVTYLQYIKVLVFYGIINYENIIDKGGFSEVEKQIENGTLDLEVPIMNKSNFKQIYNFIPGNITNQIFCEDDKISWNAIGFLNSIILYNAFKVKDLDINEQNLNLILKEKGWIVVGSKLQTFENNKVVDVLKSFKDGPFEYSDKFFIGILERLNLPR